jgi:hypothetical protein
MLGAHISTITGRLAYNKLLAVSRLNRRRNRGGFPLTCDADFLVPPPLANAFEVALVRRRLLFSSVQLEKERGDVNDK